MCGWPLAAKPLLYVKARGGVAVHGPLPFMGNLPLLPPPLDPADELEAVYSDIVFGMDNFNPDRIYIQKEKEEKPNTTTTTPPQPHYPSRQHPSCPIAGIAYNNITPINNNTAVALSIFRATCPYKSPYKVPGVPCSLSLSVSLLFFLVFLYAPLRRERTQVACFTQLMHALRASIGAPRQLAGGAPPVSPFSHLFRALTGLRRPGPHSVAPGAGVPLGL